MEFELREWQKEAIQRARSLSNFALFADPGTGKTCAAIQILREKMNTSSHILRTLIFTPPTVVPQWKEEWKKWSKLDLKMIVLLRGPQTKRIQTMEKYGFDSDGNPVSRIFITNYEALLMKDLFLHFEAWDPEAIVWDESQRIKSHDAKRSKQAYILANPFDKKRKTFEKKPYSYLLSGTPILNSSMDVFQQVKVMLGGFPTLSYFERAHTGNLITNFYHFRAYYFRDRNAGMPQSKYFPKWEPMTLLQDGKDALGEIQLILNRIGIRAKYEGLGETIVPIKVEMLPGQLKAYRELKKDLVTYHGGGACVARLAIVKALRLLQMTSGFISVKQDEPNEQVEVEFQKSPKEEALEELLENLTPHSKVLVWAVWKRNYAQIKAVCERLGLGYVEVTGEISLAKQTENVKRFQEDPNIKVFIGHPGSGGIGLNLVQAKYSIFYSRTFSLEHYIQARARNNRGGQTEHVTHYDLICTDTIDEIVLEKLKEKTEIGEKLLGEIVNLLAKQNEEGLG